MEKGLEDTLSLTEIPTMSMFQSLKSVWSSPKGPDPDDLCEVSFAREVAKESVLTGSEYVNHKDMQDEAEVRRERVHTPILRQDMREEQPE